MMARRMDMPDEQILKFFFECLNHRDLEQMEELLLEDACLYFPKTEPLSGKNRILRFMGILFRHYPELIFDVQQTIIQGSKAAIHWTNKGTSRKNKPYKNEGVTLIEFRANKISFISDFFKNTDIF